MTIGFRALREALVAAGAPEDNANNAADEIAAAFDAFDRGLADFASELKTIEGELTVSDLDDGLKPRDDGGHRVASICARGLISSREATTLGPAPRPYP